MVNERMDKAKLLAYVLGELDRDETLAIARLVDQDPEIRSEINSLRLMTQKLDQAFVLSEDVNLDPKQLQKIRKSANQRMSRQKWMVLITSLACAVIAFVTLVPRPAPVSVPVESKIVSQSPIYEDFRVQPPGQEGEAVSVANSPAESDSPLSERTSTSGLLSAANSAGQQTVAASPPPPAAADNAAFDKEEPYRADSEASFGGHTEGTTEQRVAAKMDSAKPTSQAIAQRAEPKALRKAKSADKAKIADNLPAKKSGLLVGMTGKGELGAGGGSSKIVPPAEPMAPADANSDLSVPATPAFEDALVGDEADRSNVLSVAESKAARSKGHAAELSKRVDVKARLNRRQTTIPADFDSEQLLNAIEPAVSQSGICFQSRPLPARVDLTVEVSAQGEILSLDLIPTVPRNDEAILCLKSKLSSAGSAFQPKSKQISKFEIRLELH